MSWLLIPAVIAAGPPHIQHDLVRHAERVATSLRRPAAEVAPHVRAATYAAGLARLDVDLVLAISYHETGMGQKIVGAEAVGGYSCGVMMVGQYAACPPELLTLVGGYTAGAQALRRWLEHPVCRGDLTCALWGYAGGTRKIEVCRGPGEPGCQIPREFLSIAQALRSGSRVGA